MMLAQIVDTILLGEEIISFKGGMASLKVAIRLFYVFNHNKEIEKMRLFYFFVELIKYSYI